MGNKSQSKVQKLVRRLRSELSIAIPNKFKFERTRAGHWQRSSGAWSWSLQYKHKGFGGVFEIGSQESVTSLLKAAQLETSVEFGSLVIDSVKPTKESGRIKG